MSSLTTTALTKLLSLALLGGAMSMATGCAVHSQSPIKEVAYDFSDADFYDRNYAPSPSYATSYEEYDVPIFDPMAAPPMPDASGGFGYVETDMMEQPIGAPELGGTQASAATISGGSPMDEAAIRIRRAVD